MTPQEFDACFDRFKRTAFRLETLPEYIAPGELERIEAFMRGEARPERSVRTAPWLARIALSTVSEGKQWCRVRLLDDPLTEYERYQLQGYAESQAAGEEIRIIPRRDMYVPLTPDFWLLDDAAIVFLSYDANGRWLGSRLSHDPGQLALCRQERDTALHRSVPLNEYLAAHRQATRAA
jgi:hypothetical protein